MQSKFILALVLSCVAAFVASSPVPTPAPVVNEGGFEKRQTNPTTTATITHIGGMHPDDCRYSCI